MVKRLVCTAAAAVALSFGSAAHAGAPGGAIEHMVTFDGTQTLTLDTPPLTGSIEVMSVSTPAGYDRTFIIDLEAGGPNATEIGQSSAGLGVFDDEALGVLPEIGFLSEPGQYLALSLEANHPDFFFTRVALGSFGGAASAEIFDADGLSVGTIPADASRPGDTIVYFDFPDLTPSFKVVALSGEFTVAGAKIVPTPSAVLAGLGMLGALGLAARRRADAERIG